MHPAGPALRYPPLADADADPVLASGTCVTDDSVAQGALWPDGICATGIARS